MNILNETSRRITLNFTQESISMKLVSFFCLFLISFVLSASTVESDSLLSLLQQKKPDEVIAILGYESKPQKQNTRPATIQNVKDEVILWLAFNLKEDSMKTLELQSNILRKNLNHGEAIKLIHFVYLCSYKFITQPTLFFSIQDLGIALAEKYDEPRAQFSFLQHRFTMLQITNQTHALPDILNEMRQLAEKSDYLAYHTDMQYSLYYCTHLLDSCDYYFEKYLNASKKWIGVPNPYFLNAEGYSLKKDSSIMAGVVTEYAKYHSRKGDLKKAGEYIIRSLQVTPDTSTVVLLKIRNLLAMARIYSDLVNPARALLYIEKAIDQCEKNNLDRMRKTLVASNYAYALMAGGQYGEAAEEFQLAFREHPRSLNCHDPKLEAYRYALNAALMRDFNLCRSMIDSAAGIDCQSSADILYYEAMTKGILALQTGSYDAAQLQFSSALQHAKSLNAIGQIKDVLYQQYRCHKQSGKVKESIIALEQYAGLKDSLYRTGQDVALFDIEAAYQKTIQDETIARLDAENIFTIARLNEQKRNLIIASLALVSLAILLLLVLRLYKRVKTTNALLSKAVEEKNILLREIHHRVKNNLQVISSLLKLQSGYIKDNAAIQAIAEGRSRVQSMALLHQNLYKEDNLKGVNMQEYFDNLIQGLFDTYNISSDRIQLHKNIEAISLDVDTVVPLGLITNELISNALKHAFPENAHGNLYVDLFEKSGNLILIVRDDGNGMTNNNTREGFGSKLIQSLSQKLEADITTRSTQGTEITLTIREYKKAA